MGSLRKDNKAHNERAFAQRGYSVETLNYSCQSCGCSLWSDYSRNLGTCPECTEPDEPLLDLEEQLEEILQTVTI